MVSTSDSDLANDRLRELESVTSAYARYSRSAGGLASVLGGMFCVASYLCGALLPLTVPVRAVLIAFPIVWILAKIGLTRHYYQRFGRVEESETAAERWTYRACLATSVFVAVAITIVVVNQALSRQAMPAPGVIGYLAFVVALPVATWLWLHSALDFIVGVFLFCQAAFACGGRAYPGLDIMHLTQWAPMSWLALTYPLLALALIASGFAQHRQFQSLRARLEALRGSTLAAS
ncbi:MAG: hypothetical protein ABI304_14745 [Rudaea sp.]